MSEDLIFMGMLNKYRLVNLSLAIRYSNLMVLMKDLPTYLVHGSHEKLNSNNRQFKFVLNLNPNFL